MEGYRVLESGDVRVLEAGDTRVTEGFIEGFFAQPDEEVIRILESGDIRVTENGTARSVVNYNPNFGYGYIRTAPYFKARGLFGTLIEDITRTLESGDVRITEEGDIRVSVNYNPNFGYGYINTVPFVTVFSSDPYVKYESSWLRAVPYVKYEQEWIVPSNVYRHTNGNWKRIY